MQLIFLELIVYLTMLQEFLKKHSSCLILHTQYWTGSHFCRKLIFHASTTGVTNNFAISTINKKIYIYKCGHSKFINRAIITGIEIEQGRSRGSSPHLLPAPSPPFPIFCLIYKGSLHRVCAFACLQNEVSISLELESYFALLFLILYYPYTIEYLWCSQSTIYSTIKQIANSITVIIESIVCKLTLTVRWYVL